MSLLRSEYASEVGPFDNFTSPKQISALFGIAPKKFQTGKTSFENGHITKKGRNQSRSAVMTVANNLAQGNDYYTPLYLNLLSRGKAKQHAKVAIANKFIRNSFRMIENGQLFEPPTWTGKTLKNDPIEKLKDFLHQNTNDRNLIEQIVKQAEQTLAVVLKQQPSLEETQPEQDTKNAQTIKPSRNLSNINEPEQQPSLEEKKTDTQPEQDTKNTQTIAPSRNLSNINEPEQGNKKTQTPMVIYRKPKLESVGTEVVFTRTKPSNSREPVHIGDVLENMVASGKIQAWVLTGKGPTCTQLS